MKCKIVIWISVQVRICKFFGFNGFYTKKKDMKNVVKILMILIFVPTLLWGQKGFGEEEKAANPYTFGFKINTTTYGQAVQCVIVYTNSSGKEKLYCLKTAQWARQVTGYENSKANPENKNLIKEYDIFEVPDKVIKMGEEEVKIYTLERTEAILTNLWRLRYSEFPYSTGNNEIGSGWAAHPDTNITFMPSKRQMETLQTYGIDGINDIFKDEDAFRLMRDVLDKTWQKTYEQGSQQLEID